ncbi:MAG: tetratricopeptide repeat protein [Methanotrichaceae archaeon]
MAVTGSESNALRKAVSLLSNGGLDGAMMVVERELERDPDSWEAWAAKADILYLQGMYGSALKCSEIALKFNPENALAWNTKGNALYKLSRYQEAIDCYSRAIEIEPLFVRAWHNKRLAVEMQLKRSTPRVVYLPALMSNKKTHPDGFH